ncbi:unnamed protein product [Moneuplotes crassus]|uniref:Uncharacterized protein n=1 Tax=Euplotes crassus TaxID=5936 RepID=A0AAD1XE65_EUPCR|nr:unnamed protein product [Moneuplotes crassus]
MFTRIAIKPRFASTVMFNTFRPFSGDTKIRFNHHSGDEQVQISQLKVYRKLKFDYLHGLPYDLSGTHSVPKLDQRNLIEAFFESKKIEDEFLVNKFHDMVSDLYTAIADKDLSQVASLTEKRFGTKIVESIDANKNPLKFIPNDTPNAERDEEDQSYLFDKIFEKGVFFDRERNDNNYDYYLDQTQEPEGIRYFEHKYFSGYDTHYYLKNCAEEIEDRSSKYKFRHQVQERSVSMVLRVYGVFKNVGKFSSRGADITSNKYTGNHMVVFENELHGPPSISLSYPNIESWVKRHKIDHKNWKITDIDNYMKGNPFFKKVGDSSDFDNFVIKIKEEHTPEKDDYRNLISKYSFRDNTDFGDRGERDERDEFITKQHEYNEFFEPASNRTFEEDNRKRMEEDAKKLSGKQEDNDKIRKDHQEYIYNNIEEMKKNNFRL